MIGAGWGLEQGVCRSGIARRWWVPDQAVRVGRGDTVGSPDVSVGEAYRNSVMLGWVSLGCETES